MKIMENVLLLLKHCSHKLLAAYNLKNKYFLNEIGASNLSPNVICIS